MEEIEKILIEYFSRREVNFPKGKNLRDAVSLFIQGARSAGWAHATAARFVSLFPEKEKNCHKHFIWVVKSYNLKYCASCGFLRSLEDFSKNSSRVDGLQSDCRFCCQKEQKDNPEKWAEKTAFRRAKKLEATPDWVSSLLLKEIYKETPINHHVDHIIPLVHPLVCGLHVPWNLQYLSAADNMSKSNFVSFETEELRLLNLFSK